MSYFFNGINAFDSPLFIKKNTTDLCINYLTLNSLITSSEFSNLSNLYDFNAGSIASGVTGGSNTASIIIDFGVSFSPNPDILILNNTKGFEFLRLQYSTGAGYTDLIGSTPTIDCDFMIFKFTGVTARYYKLIVSANFGTPVSIGEMILCKSSDLIYINLPAGVQSIVNNYHEKVAFNELIDGSFIGAITSVKYGATYGYEWIPQADRDNLKILKDSRTDFAVIPSPQATNEIYHVYWTNPWNFSFTDKYENAGYSGNMIVQEL